MSNHGRRRWRGKFEHLFDVQRRPQYRGRPPGSARRRARALRRGLHVHQTLHQRLADPKCPHCRDGAQNGAQSVSEAV